MKKIILAILIIAGLAFIKSSQQISLFDSDGEAIAYIDYNKEATIFIWDGTPVAFINNNGRDLTIIGFNGSFLGWYIDGIMYDKNGYVVGAIKGAVNMITKIEGTKGIQKITPLRPIVPLSPIKPLLRNNWSNTSLTEFLYFGK